MLRTLWTVTKRSAEAFVDDNALSRGAAIAFYAVTSIGPVLLIVIAVAGLVFGEDAARGALMSKLTKAMGPQSAGFLQLAIGKASDHHSGVVATIIGVVSLIITASGVFGEMQSALNAIWRASPEGTTVSRLIKSRLTSLTLVVTLGFLLLVSLVVGAAIAAVGAALNRVMPFSDILLGGLNFLISLALLGSIIAAIYKILPDTHLRWRDTAVGALVTGLLITIGKLAIGIYIGTSGIASSYGAAGSVLAALLWVYYSAEIFLFGAEFTRAWSDVHAPSRARQSVEAS
ncbi:MAG: ribonuclease BN [Rhodospirillales bacterium 20-64-7]|nr:MAG: ribonuclease BN [Rhodospirillales bacterium 20-64-7]HQT77711.1 YihY/virulence factor BrkB family protein [Rhodopila sp.]